MEIPVESQRCPPMEFHDLEILIGSPLDSRSENL
jgi:hypothetical protein